MIILKSSNAYKISEFTRLLKDTEVKVEPGEDLKEVLSNIDEVITYKSFMAGEGVLVEDTTMIINGKEEVEVKWKYKDLQTGDQVRWFISLGVLIEGKIKVYKGFLDTIVDRSLGEEGEAFEPFLIPLRDNPEKLSYTVLSQKINKDIIDPRADAVRKFLADTPDFEVDAAELSPWTKQWQND